MDLYDAAFLVGLEGDEEVLVTVADVLRAPKRPLFLGRKGCPPSTPVLGDIRAEDLEDALNAYPWLPSVTALTDEQKTRAKRVTDRSALTLDTFVEPASYVPGAATVRDVPLSRVSNDRRFLSRQVVSGKVEIPCTGLPAGTDPSAHDPLDF
jgi:CRISPR system Cascade subunit CasD